jgi:hypothetical protein
MPYYASPNPHQVVKQWTPGCPIRRVRRPLVDEPQAPVPQEYEPLASPPLTQPVEPELGPLKGWQKGLAVIKANQLKRRAIERAQGEQSA